MSAGDAEAGGKASKEDSILSPELLAILACPETKEPVALADEALLGRINARIQAGSLANRSGDALTEPLEAAVVREDGMRLYPVRGGIPIMLLDESIDWDASKA